MCKSSENNVNTEVNPYYNLSWYNENLKQLIADFLAWTNIILKTEDKLSSMATSCSMDHLSKLLKVFKPLNSASEFIKIHVTVSTDLSSLGREFIYELKRGNKTCLKKINKSNHSYLNLQENWMGRNKLAKMSEQLHD